MIDELPPLKQLNRTFIGSVLFIDIVGYTRQTVPVQLEMKELFNDMLADAVQNVAPGDRIMVDTGDGAAIAFLGDPEDALFAALSLRDTVDTGKITVGEPGFVRMGINLGPLKAVRDINGHTNMIGDGVNDAQRVMSFAEPGQVMVAHSYYDIISRFSHDYTKLFVYEGTRHDKHVREHEVYRFGPEQDNESLTTKLRDRSRARHNDHALAVVPVAPVSERAPAAYAWKKKIFHVVEHYPKRVAVSFGVVTIASAAWFWGSIPKPETETPPLASASAPAAVAPAPAESLPEPAAIPATIPATIPAAESPAPAATPEAAKPADKPTDKSGKNTDHATPPAKPGTVKFAVHPWGEIYVDNTRRGLSPPLMSLNLAPGKHKIEIRNSQFVPYKSTIDIKSNAETTVQYAF